ncbi:MAG: hypothetical protein ACREDZ_13225, partial [Kiloniellales bacterium]
SALAAPLAAGEARQLSSLLARLLAAATRSRAGARRLCRFCDHGICQGASCPVGSRARALEKRRKPSVGERDQTSRRRRAERRS